MTVRYPVITYKGIYLDPGIYACYNNIRNNLFLDCIKFTGLRCHTNQHSNRLSSVMPLCWHLHMGKLFLLPFVSSTCDASHNTKVIDLLYSNLIRWESEGSLILYNRVIQKSTSYRRIPGPLNRRVYNFLPRYKSNIARIWKLNTNLYCV